jgi:hypothetical protein
MQTATAIAAAAAAAERPPDDRYGVCLAGEGAAPAELVAEIGLGWVTWLRGTGLAEDPAPPPLTLASLAAVVDAQRAEIVSLRHRMASLEAAAPATRAATEFLSAAKAVEARPFPPSGYSVPCFSAQLFFSLSSRLIP